MRRLLLAIFLACVLLHTPVLADIDTFEGQATENLSHIEGQEVPVGQAPTVGCPSWHLNAIVAWDGLHPSGNDYACLQDGTGVQANTNTAIITTAAPCSGDACIDIHDASTGQAMRFNQAWLNMRDAAQTLCIEMYVTSRPPGYVQAFYGAGSGSDTGIVNVEPTPQYRVRGYHGHSGGTPTVITSTAYTQGQFFIYSYSWDATSTPGPHAARYDNGVWDEDAGEVVGWNSTALSFRIGNTQGGNPGAGEHIYIRQVGLLPGYQTDCNILSGN